MKTMILAAALSMVLLSFTSCDLKINKITEKAKNEFRITHEYRDSEKWGKVTSKSIDIQPFNDIEAFGNIDIEFVQSDTTSLTVLGNEKAIDAYNIRVHKGTLIVDLKDASEKNVTQNTPAITIQVSNSRCDKLQSRGAGDIKFKNDVNFPQGITFQIYGAGDIHAGHLKTSDFAVDIFGAGDLDIKKLTCEGNARIEINGAGDMEGTLQCANAKLVIKGAGDADVKVKCNEINAECLGAGDIKLKGECNTLIKKDGPIGGIDSRELKAKKVITK